MSIKKVAGNAGALLTIQFANYLLPFILAPYLTRVLDTEAFGITALGTSIILISGIISDYGFSISATYIVAKSKTKEDVRIIIGAVYSCKAIMLIPILAFIYTYPLIVESYSRYSLFFWLLSISVIGISLQPIWLFQGLEKMKEITAYTVAARLTLVLLTTTLVKSTDDIYLYSLANGVSQLLAAAIGIRLMLRHGYYPRWKSWNYTKRIFKESTEFFWSRAAVGTYGAGAAFFLGLTSNTTQIAYYAIAEQLFRGAIAIFSPITQALFPHMAKSRDISLFKRIFIISTIAAMSGAGLGIFAGDRIISIIYGQEYIGAYKTLVILMLAACAAIPSIFIGYPLLGAFGNTKAANYSVIYSGVVQLIGISLCLALNKTSAFSVACSVLCAEVFALTYRATAIRKTIYNSFK